MSLYRNALPQLADGPFLADGGIETDLIFNRGIDIREFAAHTLLPDPGTRAVVAEYFRRYLALARDCGAGFILDSQTWKAHVHWADDLGATEAELRTANHDSIAFIAGLRKEFAGNEQPIVLNGIIGPTADAYAPETHRSADEAERYHARQIGWLAETEVDMVTATTFPHADEAIGLVRAAQAAGLAVVVSFTVETDGRLPSGQALADAIRQVDDSTAAAAAYFMINCAHPDHFFHVLDGEDWSRRIRGLRCNASRLSHAELDACEVLDDGNPQEIGSQYGAILHRMPWLNVFGGCCGSDLRHITQIAAAISAAPPSNPRE
jgi:homocysteine S-methyltransferase